MASSYPLSLSDVQTIQGELKQQDPNFNRINKSLKAGRVFSSFNKFFRRSDTSYLPLIEALNKTLAMFEQKGIKFFDPNDASLHDKAKSYKEKRKVFLDTAKDLRHFTDPTKLSPKVLKAFQGLCLREMSLRYALGEANGGLNALKDPDNELLAILKIEAIRWKQKQKFTIKHELNNLEIEQLKELAKYPEWLNIVLGDTESLQKILNWSLRDFNQVEIIVKCYETSNKIIKARMSSNLGYVRNIFLNSKDKEILAFQTLQTTVQNVSKIILTLSIYHGSFKKFEPDQQERINLLDPSQKITFKQGNHTLTVKEFFEEYSKKNLYETNINVSGWGLINFHPVNGVWQADQKRHNMPKIRKEDWIDYVPPARIASHEELVAQYGDEVNNKDYFFKVIGSRKHPDLNALDCHSFWQLFIKMGDGDWKVLNIGPYGYRFTTGIFDNLWLFCSTILRVCCLMDQNGYYTFRQKGAYPIFPSEKAKDSEFLGHLYKLITEKGVFQPAGQNCSYYVQTITQQYFKNLPNFFKMPVEKAKIGVAAFDRLLAWTGNKGKWIRCLVLGMIHNLFLSFRWQTVKEGECDVSYSTRKFYQTNGYVLYNPSYLPDQILEEKNKGTPLGINGELYLNHTEEKIYQFQALLNPV